MRVPKSTVLLENRVIGGLPVHIFFSTTIRINLQVSDETYKNRQVKERSILKVDTVLKFGLIFTH